MHFTKTCWLEEQNYPVSELFTYSCRLSTGLNNWGVTLAFHIWLILYLLSVLENMALYSLLRTTGCVILLSIYWTTQVEVPLLDSLFLKGKENILLMSLITKHVLNFDLCCQCVARMINFFSLYLFFISSGMWKNITLCCILFSCQLVLQFLLVFPKGKKSVQVRLDQILEIKIFCSPHYLENQDCSNRNRAVALQKLNTPGIFWFNFSFGYLWECMSAGNF